MVYYTETLELCHPLTEIGIERYHEFLENKADEILYKHDHPIKYMFGKLKEMITSNE